MILADKIIENRKRNGWSQEELADKLNVSRQSVSKWESAQAIPDMKKILQLADLFGVSTDYLLRDDLEEEPEGMVSIDESSYTGSRTVSMEDANEYLAYNDKAASLVSSGVMLCILSPVLMILLSGLAETGTLSISSEAGSIFGLIILLIMVAAAVAMFLMAGLGGREFEYLEKENIDTLYGVSGYVKELKNAYRDAHARRLIIGIMLCVVSAIPLLLSQIVHYTNNSDDIVVYGVCILLVMCAIGVRLIVLTCMKEGGYDKLLEEGDYSRMDKKTISYDGIYWAVITAAYLCWSFINMRWDMTWIIWPVAGVLSAVYHEIVKAIINRK